MKWLKNKKIFVVGFFGTVILFFLPIFSAQLPFPSDTLLGIYHPWRDVVWSDLKAGVPFKNALITDPIRQQYPYRELSVSLLKRGEIPLWNPYAFSGTPLLANVQTAVFYPLNILFFVLPFSISWVLLIIAQPLLAGIFLYWYLRHFDLDPRAALLGALSFSFSGFFVAWLTWGTIAQVALWLPLILLAKEKLTDQFSIRWAATLVFAESAMIFAGHPQTALYIVGFSSLYLIVRVIQKEKRKSKRELLILKSFIPFVFTGLAVLFLTSIQTIPAVQLILASARNFDLPNWQSSSWFLPWIHITQLVAPDFFGNPTTGNYWGEWNYGEFVSYIGIFPLIAALFAILNRRDKKTLFYSVMLFVTLLLALPTPIARIPFQLHIPFIQTLQPSRILVLVNFALAVLAALGFDSLICTKLSVKKFVVLGGIFFVSLFVLWTNVLFGERIGYSQEILVYLITAKRNLILPTLLTIVTLGIISGAFLFVRKRKNIQAILIFALLMITILDLWRFGRKFTPFTAKDWIYPTTRTIDFLQKNLGNHRFMTTDRRLFPPNVATIYRLQTVDGYDPVYLQRYGELIAAWTRNKPDITPAAFNRILTPERVDSFFPDLLGVKYILSLTDLESEKLQLVFQEGETRVYENTNVFPRVFLVEQALTVESKQQAINLLFEHQDSLQNIAITTFPVEVSTKSLDDEEFAQIVSYRENSIVVNSHTKTARLLVLTDIWYPSWRVYIDGQERGIVQVDYALRGVIVPAGKHTIEFIAQIL